MAISDQKKRFALFWSIFDSKLCIFVPLLL
jgi:hypothetical protein